jgi:hypothetical protein
MIMSDMALAHGGETRRTYAFDLPYYIPVFGIGFAIGRLKKLGAWERLPRPLKVRIKGARSSWSGLKITRKDLDSIPDEVWTVIAADIDLALERDA